MITVYNFKDDNWENDFFYAYSPQTKEVAKFRRTDSGALTMGYNESIGNYDYISALTSKKYKSGTVIRAKCTFTGEGAPLLVFTNELVGGEDGEIRYGVHYEVVAYAGGMNVWHIVPCPEDEKRHIKPTKIHAERFEIAEGAPVEITVKIGRGEITAEVNGHAVTVAHGDIPSEFYVGFTGCEGDCAFTEFSVEER